MQERFNTDDLVGAKQTEAVIDVGAWATLVNKVAEQIDKIIARDDEPKTVEEIRALKIHFRVVFKDSAYISLYTGRLCEAMIIAIVPEFIEENNENN